MKNVKTRASYRSGDIIFINEVWLKITWRAAFININKTMVFCGIDFNMQKLRILSLNDHLWLYMCHSQSFHNMTLFI